MNDVPKTSWAQAVRNNDFICIDTCSGYRSCIVDPKGKQHLLAVDATDLVLGLATLDALAYSRFVKPVEDRSLFDYKLGTERYLEWVTSLMAKYSYKSKRALFNGMNNCNVSSCDGRIEFRPTFHEQLEGWSGAGIGKEDYVVVPSDSSAEQVGAALRIAFGRCL